MNKKLALFDFDGTITNKDSLIEFIRFAVGKNKFYLGLLVLSPVLILYFIKILPNYKAKEAFISYFFKGWNIELFHKIANQYSIEQIDKIIRPKAIEKIRWHQNQGHKVIIVSASMKCWLEGWCNNNKVDLLTTELEVIDKKITGKFANKNCYGLEKVNRIKKNYNLLQYEIVAAYGDSLGDKEMLEIATKKYYQYFN